MNVPIYLDGLRREATIEFAGRPYFDFLSEWGECLGQDKHPIRTDAVLFATLACKRFSAHFPLENYVEDVADIADHIKHNPKSEVAGLVLVRCDWFPTSKVIGLAHFRRSWCNNLILDYLAAHPWVASKPKHFTPEVRGVGTALLYFLSNLAIRYECQAIWGEATQNSCDTYQRFFDLEDVRDLLYIKREKFVKFAKLIEAKWASKT